MKVLLNLFLLISSSFPQEIFVQNEEKNLYRSAVEYSFDEVLDNGAYTFTMTDISGIINIIGHAGSGSHLIIDNRVRAVSNKNAIAILKNSQISVYHEKDKKNISIIKLSERYDHKIITTIDLHIPINTNIKGSIKNGDLKINEIRGSVELKAESVDTELSNLLGNIVFNSKAGDLYLNKTNGNIELNVISGDIEIIQSEANIFTNSDNGITKLKNIKGKIKSATTLGDVNISDFKGDICTLDINVGNVILKNSSSDIHINIDIGDIYLDNIKGDAILFTGKGEINLNDILGNTRCNSNFGNINGNNLYGSISANSELGDLIITKGYNSFLKNHNIDLNAKRGSVTLRIPSELPFHIRTHCDNLSSKDAISSEVPLNEKLYPTKVVAEGKVKDGTIDCSIYSNHGPISINTN